MICIGFGSHVWTLWIGRGGEIHLNSGAGHCGRDSSFGLMEVTPIWTLSIGAGGKVRSSRFHCWTLLGTILVCSSVKLNWLNWLAALVDCSLPPSPLHSGTPVSSRSMSKSRGLGLTVPTIRCSNGIQDFCCLCQSSLSHTPDIVGVFCGPRSCSHSTNAHSFLVLVPSSRKAHSTVTLGPLHPNK